MSNIDPVFLTILILFGVGSVLVFVLKVLFLTVCASIVASSLPSTQIAQMQTRQCNRNCADCHRACDCGDS